MHYYIPPTIHTNEILVDCVLYNMKPIMLLSALCCSCLTVRAQELIPSLGVGHLRHFPTASQEGTGYHVPNVNGWYAEASVLLQKPIPRFFQGVQLNVGYYAYGFDYTISDYFLGVYETRSFSFPIRYLRVQPAVVGSTTFARYWKTHFELGPGIWLPTNGNSELYFGFDAQAGISFNDVMLKFGFDMGVDMARKRENVTLPRSSRIQEYGMGYQSRMLTVGISVSPVKFKLARKEKSKT